MEHNGYNNIYQLPPPKKSNLKRLFQVALTGAFGPPVMPICSNSCGAKHRYAMFSGIDAVRVETAGRDGRLECANQNLLATPPFLSR
ncbi:hypothetical protein Y032_0123g1180 [Ancylostoma ceylanicum]|uniref:Uncharacterized protein n=1 Tax=Ancylostoma ceylanicum TaxID=53326 RepID=A0A016T8S4_9BILA|nr:hypothetical protein Y032_0123g1180 [Ancylostoma ceylanicum]